MDKSVYIVGGGYSLKDFDFKKLVGKDIIAVNKSLFDVPFAKYFITMDYLFLTLRKISELQQIEFDQNPSKKYFIVNYASGDLIRKEDGLIYDVKCNIVYKLLEKFDEIIESYRIDEIGYNKYDFRSGNNSGYCALQLAIVLGYTEIYLLGFDLSVKSCTHYHGGYGQGLNQFRRTLDVYTRCFKDGLDILSCEKPEIKVYNCARFGKLGGKLPYKSLDDI